MRVYRTGKEQTVPVARPRLGFEEQMAILIAAWEEKVQRAEKKVARAQRKLAKFNEPLAP